MSSQRNVGGGLDMSLIKKGWMTELTHEGAAMTNQKAEAQMNQKKSPGDARPTAVDDKY